MSRRRDAERGDARSGGSLLVWGLHACQSALAQAATDVLELWLREDAGHGELAALAATAARLGLRPQRVPAATLDRLTDGAVHQGVVLRRRPPAPLDLAALRVRLGSAARTPLVLALDHPQDPHHLGACLRVA
ncbi:MAG: RNA methyltransferase substrate-binding domain-containing protein, partial [Gammaproteobacteria bacterium]